MKNLVQIILLMVLSGCAELGLVTFHMDEMLLAPQPTPRSSFYFRDASKKLIAYESEGFTLARSNQTTWLQFVDGYYQERTRLAPNVRETDTAHEYQSYQRMLADKLDKKQISEIEWTYQLEKKRNELVERERMIANATLASIAAQQASTAAQHAANSAEDAANAQRNRQNQQAADAYYNRK